MKQVISLLFALISYVVAAQEVNNFTLVNVHTGKDVSLSDYRSAKAVTVIFTSHECPFDNYYKERIKAIIQTYSGNVQFLLVNSNPEISESKEQMAIHYTDIPVPYLADKDQVAMINLGAKKTPEVFLLIPHGDRFKLVYSGAIDDNAQSATDVHLHYLKEVIDKIVSGQKTEMSTQRATGCTIRKK